MGRGKKSHDPVPPPPDEGFIPPPPLPPPVQLSMQQHMEAMAAAQHTAILREQKRLERERADAELMMINQRTLLELDTTPAVVVNQSAMADDSLMLLESMTHHMRSPTPAAPPQEPPRSAPPPPPPPIDEGAGFGDTKMDARTKMDLRRANRRSKTRSRSHDRRKWARTINPIDPPRMPKRVMYSGDQDKRESVEQQFKRSRSRSGRQRRERSRSGRRRGNSRRRSRSRRSSSSSGSKARKAALRKRMEQWDRNATGHRWT